MRAAQMSVFKRGSSLTPDLPIASLNAFLSPNLSHRAIRVFGIAIELISNVIG
jgi:hypothetical protein